MRAIFNAKRYFTTSEGWFIELRDGDELVESNHLRPRIKKRYNPEMVVAGPFLNKIAMKLWFIGFLSFYAKSRKPPENYISDDIIISDLNNTYI